MEADLKTVFPVPALCTFPSDFRLGVSFPGSVHRQVYYVEIADRYLEKSAQFETDKIPRTFDVQNADM